MLGDTLIAHLNNCSGQEVGTAPVIATLPSPSGESAPAVDIQDANCSLLFPPPLSTVANDLYRCSFDGYSLNFVSANDLTNLQWNENVTNRRQIPTRHMKICSGGHFDRGGAIVLATAPNLYKSQTPDALGAVVPKSTATTTVQSCGYYQDQVMYLGSCPFKTVTQEVIVEPISPAGQNLFDTQTGRDDSPNQPLFP
jgi:hypothetical protein